MTSMTSTAVPTASGPPGGTLSGWISKTLRLRCSISYLKICELRFSSLEDPRPFDPHRPIAESLLPPVEEVPEGYDVVVVRHEILASPIPKLQRLPNFLCYAPRQLTHYYTDLRGGPDQAFRSMSSKTRSTVLRKVKAFREFSGGTISWRVYKTPQEMMQFHELARQLARKTYQERLFDSGLPDSESFVSEMLQLARQDLVRGFLLFHQDIPIAYLYTPAPHGFLIYDYLGYDPQFSKHSPGTVLQYLALDSLYAEQRFSFYYWGNGFSQTKEIFSTGKVLASDLLYFRPTLRTVAAVRLHCFLEAAVERAGAILERLSLKAAIKRALKKL
jgi:hypothetical protein